MPYTFTKRDTYYSVDTGKGLLFIRAVNGKTFYVTSRGDYSTRDMETGLTNRGVNYYVTAHYQNSGHGMELMHDRIYLSRNDFKDASFAAKAHFTYFLNVVVQEFFNSHVGQEALKQAGVVDRKNRIDSLREELAQAEAKVEEIKKKLAATCNESPEEMFR